jgi:hypothetical protein
MKIIISNNQYSLIKESYRNKGIGAVIKYWKKELEKGNEIKFDRDELEYWGITKFTDKLHAQTAFQELVGDEVFAKKFINTFKNNKFSTEDFLHLNIGGYNFEWVITNMEYRDYDFYLYGKTLPGGTVTLMDGRHLSLNEAIKDEDIGWEIKEEIKDAVLECMDDIILPVTGNEIISIGLKISKE